MVGAMPRVDAVLQRSKCAIDPRPSKPSTGFPYQLKRRRLLPDVRDPPEQGNAEVDMQDI